MNGVIVDSNVLIDIATADPVWGPWSRDRLSEIADQYLVVINPVIYAEVSVSYDSIDQLNAFLSAAAVVRQDIPFDAAFLAGKAFASYRKRTPDRQSLLPDFLIGAHAAVSGYAVMTRDDRRYRGYFPMVKLITPKRAH